MPTKNWGVIASGSLVTEAAVVILIHQLLYQGMFLAKNALLRHRLGQPVRGSNREANLSIAFFAVFIAISVALALSGTTWGTTALLTSDHARLATLALLSANMLVAAASLLDLGNSWRVGIIEEQHTALVETGIYRFSRNPYFLSYLLMFGAYTVLLQSLPLLFLSLVGFALIHAMIRREEDHLGSQHGEAYERYCQRVPRYLFK